MLMPISYFMHTLNLPFQVDFVDFFSYAFAAAGVDETTMVALQEKEYIYFVMESLSNIMNGPDGNSLKRLAK